MARVTWGLICTNYSIDKDKNTISLFEVIEEVRISPVPNIDDAEVVSIPWNATIVFTVERDQVDEEEMAIFRITRLAPNVDPVLGPQMEVDLGGFVRQRLLASLQKLEYSGDGSYDFVIQRNIGGPDEWEDDYRISFLVIAVDE